MTLYDPPLKIGEFVTGPDGRRIITMYNYEKQKERLFTDEGQRLFVAFRDHVLTLLKKSGAVRMQEISLPPGIGAADGWDLIACADRMVELGDMRELTGPNVAGQHRVFVTMRE